MKNSMYSEMFAIFIIIFMLILLVVSSNNYNNIQNEAIKRGFAEWQVIGKNDTKFIWKE
jgi:uncharacterized membrane protein YidH (DUF202 family)